MLPVTASPRSQGCLGAAGVQGVAQRGGEGESVRGATLLAQGLGPVAGEQGTCATPFDRIWPRARRSARVPPTEWTPWSPQPGPPTPREANRPSRATCAGGRASANLETFATARRGPGPPAVGGGPPSGAGPAPRRSWPATPAARMSGCQPPRRTASPAGAAGRYASAAGSGTGSADRGLHPGGIRPGSAAHSRDATACLALRRRIGYPAHSHQVSEE